MITCKNLSYQYENSPKLALCDINLTIQKGEFIAILGANGSGKSTLAKHFNALLLPSTGECRVNGMDTGAAENTFKIRANCGMVFQNPDNQIVSGVVEEDVAFAPENLGVPPGEIRRRVDSALAAVNMTKYIKHAPHLLSGGEKQRIAIAGVLAMNPEIIIFDEPTAMLDPAGRRGVMKIIRQLHVGARPDRAVGDDAHIVPPSKDKPKTGKTIILITHNMQEVVNCDRLILLKEGRLVAAAPPGVIFSQIDLIHDCGLELPQVQQLLYNLAHR
ncbi:MAG: energy-coupling factor transporter ATPase [Oscillospiraceae bacterium]|nr:energy-coupling factor transporter ATPase [Oscillospiraceae bacterium]